MDTPNTDLSIQSARSQDFALLPLHFSDVQEKSIPDSLTFPSYRPLIGKSKREDGAWGIAANEGDEIVGLALAEQDGENKRKAMLCSLAVEKKQRRQGIASKLLASLESLLVQRGIERIEASFTSAMESYDILVRLFANAKWSEPIPRVLFCRGEVHHFVSQAPLLERVQCPPDYELFPWEELTASERKTIEKHLLSGAAPRELSPFYEEDAISWETSVGLRHDGEVIGWQVNHSMSREPNVLRYSRLFVYPRFQRTGRALILVKAAIEKHKTVVDKYPRFLSDVPYERPEMVRFYRRHIVPYCLKSYSSYGVSKVIA